MRVCVELPVPRHPAGGWLEECAATAETLGYFAVGLADHPAPTAKWLRSGHPSVDPFVGLGVAAGATSTLRLHTNVVVLGYRHPLMLARLAASLDALSGGRLVLGVGAGYLKGEFAALGAEFEHRGSEADRILDAAVEAWSGEPTGEHDTVIQPRPVQRPHPPIWVGGNSRAAMLRAARHGQGWSPMPSSLAAESLLGTPPLDDVTRLARRVAELHQLAADHGRPERLDVIAIPPSISGFARAPWIAEQALDEIGELVAAGATAISISVEYVDPARWRDEIGRFAESVLSRI